MLYNFWNTTYANPDCYTQQIYPCNKKKEKFLLDKNRFYDQLKSDVQSVIL